MTLQVALNHQTRYRYDRSVSHSPQVIRLRPAPHNRTPILSYSLQVQPTPHFLNWLQDPQGNWLARVVFLEKVDHFEVTVDLVAELSPYNPFDFFVEDYAEQQPFEYQPDLARELRPFRETLPLTPHVADYLAGIDRTPGEVIPFLIGINRQLQQRIAYLIRLEPGVQTPEQTLAKGSGSCRDSAWLLVQLLRQLGYAARFVSGYLIQLKADVKPLEGPPGPAEDFTDLHAWCEVYVPGAGWIGLDPTSGLFAAEGHIPLAATPGPVSAAPVSGSTDRCEVDFSHRMSVQRIAESPRVTLPYSEAQWAAIDRLGARIDRCLAEDDVRLTMGGEPTFVSVDDMDGAEWNTAALGDEKRRRARVLMGELRAAFAPDGVTLAGQGKWYPGEPLPRWADHLYWRCDGQPLWRDAMARAQGPVSIEQGEQLLQAVADRLGIDSGHVMPAYEDPWHYLHQEQLLPVDWREGDPRLDRLGERARLMQALQRGLDRPAGFVLPLQPWQGRAWRSGRWPLRSGRLLLIPGDSPLGLRLPLHSLPGERDSARPPWFAQDPMAPREPFSGLSPLMPADPQLQPRLPPEPPVQPSTAAGEALIITALCVEPRDDALGVFLPPVPDAEAYLALLAAVQDAGEALQLPVQIEGYPPPPDHRLNHISVTPDPGVIEVNIHPAHSWAELRDNTVTLYEAAHRARLGTEKFDLDGRHVGTGGGNHLVLGGPTPADSPFLRRPDLLASLIRYWQHHPALSYLFASQFIGPTSQAPRVDEARDDDLYELEIALQQLPEPGQAAPPWLVDRVLRHLLTDITGNTHRAEICIDKLYSPDSAGGRLGLVEFRSFEMPPHPRMSLVQQLLLRALVSRFWREPYTRPPIHWGNALHDRFMLPHFLAQDLGQVIDELRGAGLPFERDWFAPHLEFRCPRLGAVSYAGISLTLRRALEPWLTLGEETTRSGTARYVDSSLERLELKLSHFTPGRYRLACNGRALPLTPTGRPGEYVAGLRYRAWQPPSCLHPTIPVDTPLVFDLVDSWSGRAIGGCTWHVVHPGGRHYERFPVNAHDAQCRREALFKPFGHSPGLCEVRDTPPNPAMPCTLDLRWQR